MTPFPWYKKTFYFLLLLLSMTGLMSTDCHNQPSPNPTPTPTPNPANEIDAYITTGDQSSLIQKQTSILSFATTVNGYPDITVDSSISYQSVDGFGYTLTGASAYLINQMDASSRQTLLNELFQGTAVSFLRVSMGASDLSTSVFSYDDMPAGQTDPTLANFSLSQDTTDLVPVLKQILLLNPNLKILASPWSPPVWMKSNGSSMGGSLLTPYYSAYANYFVKYIQAMAAKGIPIHSVTIQNEPEHGGNNPSMVMTATEQTNFIKNNLGPAFQTAGISTKIIVWDHNCDNPNYPITIMNDAAAKAFIDGAAFHLYAGDISALSTVKTAHPDKNLYFTEQWTSSTGSFDGDLKWHMKNVIIGSMRNWSKVALEWNLANDPSFSMHTPGGCTACKGAVTINGSTVVVRSVSYYIIMQIAKFVPAGSKRISSVLQSNLPNVAFLTPSGKKVLLVLNEGASGAAFNIDFKNKRAVCFLQPNAVGTYIW